MNEQILSLIPLSKTIIKDCTLLELQSNETRLQKFLATQDHISQDVKACYDVLYFRNMYVANVGNFRSLLIGLKVLEQIKGIKFNIEMSEQLKHRELDLNSSQWESAKICCGQKSDSTKYHVEIARNVVKRYEGGERESLFNTKDEVYLNLMEFMLDGYDWYVPNPEIDVFYAIFYPEWIEYLIKSNPTWKHHETDRSKSILEALEQFCDCKTVTSDDHRIVIGISLLAILLDEKVQFSNFDCVKKSFPRFDEVVEILENLK